MTPEEQLEKVFITPLVCRQYLLIIYDKNAILSAKRRSFVVIVFIRFSLKMGRAFHLCHLENVPFFITRGPGPTLCGSVHVSLI